MIPDLAIVIAILGAMSAFLFTLSSVPAKSPLAKTLEELQSPGAPGSPEKQNRVEQFIERALPPEQRGKLAARLVEAGWYTVTPVQMVLRTAGAAFAAAIVLILYTHYMHFPPLVFYMLAAALTAAILYAPTYLLNAAVERRKAEVQLYLPDFLDMVASTVQAGLSLNAAFGYAVDSAPGAIGEEIKEALTEIRLGRARADALKGAADRLRQEEFTTMVAAINQAERLGANIGKILSELADDTRSHRILLVEEHAAKLPVKMVFPMAFFLLPCLFVIIFGSLIVNYLAGKA